MVLRAANQNQYDCQCNHSVIHGFGARERDTQRPLKPASLVIFLSGHKKVTPPAVRSQLDKYVRCIICVQLLYTGKMLEKAGCL